MSSMEEITRLKGMKRFPWNPIAWVNARKARGEPQASISHPIILAEPLETLAKIQEIIGSNPPEAEQIQTEHGTVLNICRVSTSDLMKIDKWIHQRHPR